MSYESQKRYLFQCIADDLKEKMVFLGGPRQVGKTTLALHMLKAEDFRHPAYMTWDRLQDRQRLMKGEVPSSQPLIIFDELHKFSRWRNLIKGLYDTRERGQTFLVTGSARLDYYRRGGDSLQGRYHYYRLHPYSLGELGYDDEQVETLLRFGGFPEPLFKASDTSWRRWQRQRVELVVRDDLRDLERVREVALVELLIDALPSRVGSPLSVKSLREDLEVAQQTAERWLKILENLYFCFRIAPFGAPRVRAVKKEQKLYLWDWSAVSGEGARFENMVASHLLKYCHFIEDTEGHRMELRYLRDTDGREVDFIVLRDKKPQFAVEVKHGEQSVTQHLRYFKDRVQVPQWFQLHMGTKDIMKDGVRVTPFVAFCRELRLP